MSVTLMGPATGLTKSKLALATATEGDVLNGKTFYGGSDKGIRTGTLYNGGREPTGSSLGTYNPGNGLHFYIYLPNVNSSGDSSEAKALIQRAIKYPASGFGNASASQLLSGVTASSSNGLGFSGTMTNRGSWSTSINPGGSATIPAGYHNGSGKVTATTSGVKNIRTDYVTYSDHNSTWPSMINIPAGGITFSLPSGRTLIGVTEYKVHSNGVSGTWYWSDHVIQCSGNSIYISLKVASTVEVYYAYY